MIEVQYNCRSCRRDFVVFHRDGYRNRFCEWCGSPVKPTGRVRRRNSLGRIVTEYELENTDTGATPGCVWMVFVAVVSAITIYSLWSIR